MEDGEILDAIISIVLNYCHPEKLVLFGSRAKGTNSPGSDFDIAFYGQVPDIQTEWKIRNALNAIPTLKGIDIVWIEKVEKEFREIIESTGRIIYDGERIRLHDE